jgi:NADPH:quinone reductase and related Zn-dependent oxidoreductases
MGRNWANERMRAIRYHERGGIEVLKLEEVPLPAFGEDEVLVKVLATGVNPGDWQIRSGLAGDRFPLPYIPGWDISGIVARTGGKVTGLKPGDRVYGMTANSGGCAQYAAVPASQLAAKPSTLSDEEAAAIPMSAFTAWHALFQQGNVEPGQTVLVNGASGGVGHFAVQLAKQAGARVIGAASSASEAFVRELGADEYAAYDRQQLAALENAVDVVLDTVGGNGGEWLLEALKPEGKLVPVAWGSYPEEIAARKKLNIRDVTYPPITKEGLDRLRECVDEGRLRVVLDSVHSLERTGLAHERSESRRARGKIAIRVQEED